MYNYLVGDLPNYAMRIIYDYDDIASALVLHFLISCVVMYLDRMFYTKHEIHCDLDKKYIEILNKLWTH